MSHGRNEITLKIVVSPGRLGLTLQVVGGGAEITKVDAASMLHGQVHVGDLIVSVDGKRVRTMEDVKAGQERVRNLEIVTSSSSALRLRPGIVRVVNEIHGMTTEASTAAATIPDTTSPITTKTQGRKYPDGHTNSEYYQMDRDMIKINTPQTQQGISKPSHNHPFPNLDKLGGVGDSPAAESKREALLSELLQYDRRYNKKTTLTLRRGGCRFQPICIPIERKRKEYATIDRENMEKELDKEALNNLIMQEHNGNYETMDNIINAWASFCDGTDADAASMMLFYLAKHYPNLYVKNVKKTLEKDLVEMATKRHYKVSEKKRDIKKRQISHTELPPDFVSHDGTSDISWNTRYSELLQYKEEFGDCKVYTRSELGVWVLSMRALKRKGKGKALTPKRIELLDNIG